MHKYQLLERIGEGSFGVVYRAVSNKGVTYAIKEITNCNPFERERVQEEVNIMKSFNHQNLLRVEECIYDAERSTMFIVMEYCDMDLLKFFKQKHTQLAHSDILFIFKEIVKAFMEMNAKGVVHRDLKPENLLVTKQGHIKVADFGCAKKLQSQALQRIIMSFDKGTATYASPQILKSLPYSAKCDIWSAGCVLYVLATGKHPFFEINVNKTIKLIEDKTKQKCIAIPNEEKLDSALVYAIKRCLKFTEVERCSWREFSLCRLFQPKIQRVKSFLDYLKNMSNIANWLSQTFWKQRKQLGLTDCRDEIFAYFTIKYQSSILELGLKILQKDKMWSYLFQAEVYTSQNIDQSYKDQFKSYSVKTKSYLDSVKAAIQSPKTLAAIAQSNTTEVYCFADLQNSIIYAQKLLPVIGGICDVKLMSVVEKWISFQKYFDYEKRPTLQKLLGEKLDGYQESTGESSSSSSSFKH